MAGFLFRLETEDGAPAEPPTLSSAVPNWGEGDTIHLGKRTLRVVGSETTTPTNPRYWWLRTLQTRRGLAPRNSRCFPRCGIPASGDMVGA